MKNKKFSCHKISEGVAEAEVIVSKDDIMFYLIEPETGKVMEQAHDLEGKSIAQKILIFPSGKGSSVVQADGLYQLNQKGNAPKAMIIQHPETVLVSSAIIMEIPMVDKVDPEFYKVIKDGDRVRVDANNGTIEILS
ncbi:aconitase X swivel domain-containing protein [Natronincola ferrireducens]|uniref:Predicted aconitase subunit 2 n=1 Tax=Natronincola ferrireducens TaxID=393762 RepID=A0A1G8XPS4_9FIRM|nr:DUF126 domain-containing protein [Natronincola ferrireducens]SDJ92174.1 predicted aconitase subunit 2 [Natronincola ferrireducens]